MELLQAFRRQFHHASTPRVQVLSDLHLEVGQQYSSYTFPASAPFLLLAGDIGRLVDYEGYLRFLTAQVSRYVKVFLVLGNHEFYGLGYDAGIAQAQRLAAEPSLVCDLVLLHKARWDDPNSGLTIIGCTLWSAIPQDRYAIVEAKINDFTKIHDWTPQRHSQVHAEEVCWLREQVAQANSGNDNGARQLLVATHYAPCIEGTSRPEHTANPWTPAFATELLHENDWRGVRTWVFGHTHYSTAFQRNGIRVVANQRGYVLPGSAAQREESAETSKKKSCHEFDAARVITA